MQDLQLHQDDNLTVHLADRHDSQAACTWAVYAKEGFEEQLERQVKEAAECVSAKGAHHDDFIEAWRDKKSGSLHLVSKYISGQILAAHIGISRHITVDLVKKYLRQVLDVLDNTHKRGQTIGELRSDSILRFRDDKLYVTCRNQRIKTSINDPFGSLVIPFLNGSDDSKASMQKDIRAIAGIVLHLLTKEKISEKEEDAMLNAGRIPGAVYKVMNYSHVRDFIINGCINQQGVKKASDLKNHPFLAQSYISFSSFLHGNKAAVKYCQELILKEPIMVEDIELQMKSAKEFAIGQQDAQLSDLKNLELQPEE